MGITIGANQAKELLEKGIAEAENLMKDTSKIDELLQSLELKLKEIPVAGDALSNVPLMAAMIKAYITKEYTEVSPKVIACMVGAFLYLVKKEDLIPDSLPVIGLADDIAVTALAFKACEEELNEFARWRSEHEAG